MKNYSEECFENLKKPNGTGSCMMALSAPCWACVRFVSEGREQRMNNIRDRAMKIVNQDLIYA